MTLLNDLEAGAYGIFTLDDDDVCTLNEGTMRQSGNKALIAAGTGLGQAILYDDGQQFSSARFRRRPRRFRAAQRVGNRTAAPSDRRASAM